MHPRVLDCSSQRFSGYMPAVDCEATSVEIGLVVEVDMVGARRAVKLGNVGPRIFVREVCVRSQSFENRNRNLSINPARSGDEFGQLFSAAIQQRQVPWTIGVAVVFLGAVLVYS